MRVAENGRREKIYSQIKNQVVDNGIYFSSQKIYLQEIKMRLK
jgi:hypothetical protein